MDDLLLLIDYYTTSPHSRISCSSSLHSPLPNIIGRRAIQRTQGLWAYASKDACGRLFLWILLAAATRRQRMRRKWRVRRKCADDSSTKKTEGSENPGTKLKYIGMTPGRRRSLQNGRRSRGSTFSRARRRSSFSSSMLQNRDENNPAERS